MRIQYGFSTDGTGEKLTPFPGAPGSGQGADTDDQEAVEVPYDNSGSGLGASDVQGAIDALAAQVAACCDSIMGGGQFSSGDLLSTGEVGGTTGQDQIYAPFVPPVNGDFAWVNDDGVATVTVNANGGIYLRGPAGGSIQLRIRKKAAPSTPYVITAAVLINVPGDGNMHGGLCFRRSSDGKLVTYMINRGGANAMFSQDYTDAENFSANNISLTFIDGITSLIWLRIEDNGTNRIMSWSADGYNFTQFFSEGRTTFLTADEVGFFVSTTSGTYPAGMTLLSWEET